MDLIGFISLSDTNLNSSIKWHDAGDINKIYNASKDIEIYERKYGSLSLNKIF